MLGLIFGEHLVSRFLREEFLGDRLHGTASGDRIEFYPSGLLRPHQQPMSSAYRSDPPNPLSQRMIIIESSAAPLLVEG